MNTAVFSLLLLTCTVVCVSAGPLLLHCRCLTTVSAVRSDLVKSVTEFPPRPYCSQTEVIALMKNGEQKCLDPKGRFAKTALDLMKRLRFLQAAKMTTRNKMMAARTTTAPTTTTLSP